jgi:hypothetical protein
MIDDLIDALGGEQVIGAPLAMPVAAPVAVPASSSAGPLAAPAINTDLPPWEVAAR